MCGGKWECVWRGEWRREEGGVCGGGKREVSVWREEGGVCGEVSVWRREEGGVCGRH